MERDSYYDNARFLLIFLVVAGHVVAYTKTDSVIPRSLFVWVHLFHMPMFVLISGCFSRPDSSLRYMLRNAGRLIAPYMIFETAALVLVSLRDGKVALDYHLPRNVLWYLVSLFCWRSILPYALRFRWVLPASVAVSLLCGYCPAIGWHFSLSRTLVFFPFFLAGYYLRDGMRQTLERVIPGHVAIAVLAVACVVSPCLVPIRKYWFFGATSYASMGHVEWYAAGYRAMVIAAGFLVGLSFMRLVPGRTLSFTRYGRRTLYVFLLHDMVVLTALDCFGVLSLFSGSLQESMGIISLSILITLFLSSSFIVRVTMPLVNPLKFMEVIRASHLSRQQP